MLDAKHSFDTVMLYGSELSLVIFELLLIGVVDGRTYDFVTDAVITYLVMEVSTRLVK